MMRRSFRHRERGGVALMFALLIVALAASVAAAVSYDMVLDMRRTTSLLWQEQARLFAYGAEDWVGDVLVRDAQDTEDDHLGELWAQELPPLPVEGVGIQGVVAGRIVDLQSRFNLNNLLATDGRADDLELERFRRLLQLVQIDPQRADAVIDWMDGDTEVRFPGGAEDETYTTRLPPVLTANRPFRSVGELALIEGFDAEAMARLRPHITALPARTTLNANTATSLVLQAMDENVSAGDIERVLEERQEFGIEELQVTFGGLLTPESITALDLATNFFELRSVVRIGTSRFTMYSLVFRSEQGDIAVVMRSFGSEL
ncbi:MAG: type II secretion system minor pseudopilin GspK [Pseudomonadota bacterium]